MQIEPIPFQFFYNLINKGLLERLKKKFFKGTIHDDFEGASKYNELKKHDYCIPNKEEEYVWYHDEGPYYGVDDYGDAFEEYPKPQIVYFKDYLKEKVLSELRDNFQIVHKIYNHPTYRERTEHANFIIDKLNNLISKAKNQSEFNKYPIIEESLTQAKNRLETDFLPTESNSFNIRDKYESLRYIYYYNDSDKLIYTRNKLIELEAIENIRGNEFKRIFSGSKVRQPVVWIGQKSDLRTFIVHLNKYNLIDYPPKKLWPTVIKCFISKNPNGFYESFDPDNLKTQKASKNEKTIISIVEGLKPTL